MRKTRKKKKIKVRFFILLTVLILGIVTIGFQLGRKKTIEPKKTYQSEIYLVYNRTNKEIIFEKNADQKTKPASLTKMMTVWVGVEQSQDLEALVCIDTESYLEMVAQNASMAGFVSNECVSMEDLLYGTMLSSGGEAANTMALHVAGSIPSFVDLMNEKAQMLEMSDTHFTNIEGLDDQNQLTTAMDMVKLLDHALDDEAFRTIFTSTTHQTTQTLDHPDGLTLTSTVLGSLSDLERTESGLIGGKSGTTEQAGACWATLAEINGEEIITIVMKAPLTDINNDEMIQKKETLDLLEEYRQLR